ncbi:MAG: hypothetical protein JJ896_01815 [Rhodothermales bacterium]|nr:hypothetical protein [Rhodothermales bacterium]MBO6778365.1 hypothetical protein [Rhodothermales bacterium]
MASSILGALGRKEEALLYIDEAIALHTANADSAGIAHTSSLREGLLTDD